MGSKAFYIDLVERLRTLAQTMERIGCAGFDLKQSGILTEENAFTLSAGADLAIVILNAAIDASRHAIDIVDGISYADPMTEKEMQLLSCVSDLCGCSTPQNGL